MQLLGHLCVHLLEIAFFTGAIGSVSVVLFSIAEDLRGYFSADENA